MLPRSLRLIALLLLGLVLAGPVVVLRRRARGQAIIAGWMYTLARALGLRMRVRGVPPRRTALWCSNHVSWLDVVVLGAIGRTGFVSKAEVRAWPLIGWFARAAGTVFLQRGAGQGSKVSALISEQLRRGRAVAVFPEGTTSEGTEVKRLHPRLFGSAIAAAAPIQPVALRFSEGGKPSTRAPFVGADTFVAHLLGILRLADGLDVDVRLLPLVEPRGLDRRSLAQAVRTMIQSGLNELSDRRICVEYPLPAATEGRFLEECPNGLAVEGNS